MTLIPLMNRYIYRFRNPEQLQAEAGYYLTNLVRGTIY